MARRKEKFGGMQLAQSEEVDIIENLGKSGDDRKNADTTSKKLTN